MLNSRLSVFLSLFFVFLSGALLGTLGYRWYTINTGAQEGSRFGQKKGPMDPAAAQAHLAELKKRILADMVREVKIDPQQVAQISAIMDDVRSEFGKVHDDEQAKARAIRQQQIERINEVLRPDQRPLYEQLRAKREAERRKRQGIQQDTGKK
jgi:hypothetical protein